ncbi:MAG: UDP-N-acetylmuramate dehydrogenase, partial [Pirellulaceae bacterium]
MGLIDGFEHIVRENEILAPYTWFRLGGPAQYFAEPTTAEELGALVKRCREEDVVVRLLGGGSNLLVKDEGAAGMIVHLSAPAFSDIRCEGNVLRVGGGAKLSHVISSA